MLQLSEEQAHMLLSAGVSPAAVTEFDSALQVLRLPSRPTSESLANDTQKALAIYRAGQALLAAWPRKPLRDTAQGTGAATVKTILRAVRNAFARTYAERIYSKITNGYRSFVRAEELVYRAAELCPGLCPTKEAVEAELRLPLPDKEGTEIAQGDFLSHVLSSGKAGSHLLHTMLRPRNESRELLDRFRRDGRLDLETTQVERRGTAGYVFFNNPRYLNAEDDTTMDPLETAVDLVLLDPEIEVGILRGTPMEHPKYRGRRIFSAGLNLTRLYEGKLPFMFFPTRDLGFVNKLYRGLTGDTWTPDLPEDTLEKPWMGVVEGFAIGGGCQLLLVMDYVIAEDGAYFNLPARKEGIIPGAAPMRLGSFTGMRRAQEGILFGRTFPTDSPEGRALVNEVVPYGEIDAAIERVVNGITGSGVVSFGANRKAIRIGQESPDLFRRYMALYCRDQADCHFSPALTDNLQRLWASRNRPPPQDRKN
ncbi:MAG TPA: enoyl-CoA hydratase/isomerase family protein [Geobacteraceae bacterium]|nr:enoyl-CoA hydratase/isomerase family protein [Geobacteraceae bacterium]